MQKLSWYFHRLRSMSLPEIGWRLSRKARSPLDRRRVTARREIGIQQLTTGGSNGEASIPRIGLGPCDSELAKSRPNSLQPAFDDLLRRADLICEHRIDLFDMQAYDLGPSICWNREYKADKPTALAFVDDVDYRDYSEVGDCKFVWELNRHPHWVVLARAYRLTGERKYAEAIVKQFDSWVEQCPYGLGMNWRSPLELGIRLINWVWAFEWIHKSGLLDKARRSRLLQLVYLHLWDITRNYSQYSSANNHLIGEATGVFIASSAFPGLKKAARWQAESREILEREIHSQTYADGGNKEQALGYHLFVLEFFMLAGLVSRKVQHEFSDKNWSRLQSMFEFLAAFLEGGGLPVFGDCDDGYVMDLGGGLDTYPHQLLAVGATLFDRADWANLSQPGRERVYWLSGNDGLQQFDSLCQQHRPEPLRARAFPQSGRYLLQSGSLQAGDQISVTFDCGELGFGSIAAHGHADALSVTVRINGQDLLVDPGTYDYFTYRPWRDYFRSTRSHNTVVVDGLDQSEMLGLFMWGKRANARCLRFDTQEQGGLVEGEHDGYSRLSCPVAHRRITSLDARRKCVTIVDELSGSGSHTADLYLHFGPECRVEAVENNVFAVVIGKDSVLLHFDNGLKVSLYSGDLSPIIGWTSDGYHKKRESVTLRVQHEWRDQWRNEIQMFFKTGNALKA